jgi:hypothetical protein
MDRKEIAKALIGLARVAVAPPGWEGTVKKMKKHPEIDNPWALAWWGKNEGHEPHYRRARLTQKRVRLTTRLAAMKAIELVQIPGAIMESQPQYMITFRKKPWGKLYFNTRGYVAEHGIPVPSSSGSGEPSNFSIGERSLSAYKSEISKANREWASLT